MQAFAQATSTASFAADVGNYGVRQFVIPIPQFVPTSTTIFDGSPPSLPLRSDSVRSSSGVSICHFQRHIFKQRLVRHHARASGPTIESVNEKEACTDTCTDTIPRDGDRTQVKLVAIVGDKISSPLRQEMWEDVMMHMAQRLKWVDEGYEMFVINDKALKSINPEESYQNIVRTADILIVVSVNDVVPTHWILKNSRNISNVVCFDSSADLETRLGGTILPPKDLITKFRAALPRNSISKDLKVLNLVEKAWNRKTSDDIRFMLLILIDAYVSPVESLKNLRATNFSSLECMIKNCGPEIRACLLDANCRKALSCLTSCDATDQVCSYECIASYESPQLENFSFCILQKHNCLGLTADISSEPYVQPLKVFRGQPLNHDIAEDLFIGWLGKLKWSWRVVAGQNPAYDHFPCQFQIFYRGRGKNSMWYDPVFRVRTRDDRLIWRRRHYSVKRRNIPGNFIFSVLDNGVVSREHWTIVDVRDDLSWGFFYYSGAAAAAGQSYTGGVLVTPDGQWPADSEQDRLNIALQKCGIKLWELYMVDNASCEGPPLESSEKLSIPITYP